LLIDLIRRRRDDEDDDPDSLVRAPLKPKPYSGAAAIALKEPDPPEEEA